MDEEYFPDKSAEGLEFIETNSDGSFKLSIDADCTEQEEVYHEFELMRLAIKAGRVAIDEEARTATLIVKVPIMNKEDVVRWMSLNRETYIDSRTGELDYTRLAEEAADMFNLCEGDDCTVPEWVFEASAELE